MVSNSLKNGHQALTCHQHLTIVIQAELIIHEAQLTAENLLNHLLQNPLCMTLKRFKGYQ
ncbi:MAG: hypothetical protein F6J86_37705 [Symploca sp. SIO1B1]|nr:hypothetical protein [Symploca sp. SIO1B1]